MKKKKLYPADFKLEVVFQRMFGKKNANQIALDYGIDVSTVHKWTTRARKALENVRPPANSDNKPATINNQPSIEEQIEITFSVPKSEQHEEQTRKPETPASEITNLTMFCKSLLDNPQVTEGELLETIGRLTMKIKSLKNELGK